MGDGPDAITRATDLANKFEQHVFTATSTRDDYLKVILQRMQQIQQRRRTLEEGGEGEEEHTESDKLVVQQKLGRLQAALPAMEGLLARCKGRGDIEVEVVQRCATLRERLRKQLEVGIKGLSVTMATTLVDQLSHYTAELSALLTERPPKNPKPTIQMSDNERRLIDWINKYRGHGSNNNNNVTAPCRFNLPSRTQLDPPSDFTHTRRLLEREIESLCRRIPSLHILLEVHPWGFALRCGLQEGGEESMGIRLPLDYPSAGYFLTALAGPHTGDIVNRIKTGTIAIFSPTSLTTLINVYTGLFNQ